jgi:methylglutaconyl-CoA hydratase
MTTGPVQVQARGNVATVTLNDPDRRNALGSAMFDALEMALGEIAASRNAVVVLLRGNGRCFCAGFDLAAAARDPAVMGTYIERLSGLLRAVRRLPQVTVAAVHGAAIAGGCAIVSACDLVVVSATARLGYPVHRIGVSPAVTIPTLQQAVGPGPARALLLGGEPVDGRTAHRIGLASHLSRDDRSTLADADALCETLAARGPDALRATKAWLNELEGTLDDRQFDGPMRDTAALARGDEARRTVSARLRDRYGP